MYHDNVNSSQPAHKTNARQRSNAKQRTQGKQNQRSKYNTSKPKTEHRVSRPRLETTDDRKPKPTHQPQVRKSLPSKPPTEAYLNLYEVAEGMDAGERERVGSIGAS